MNKILKYISFIYVGFLSTLAGVYGTDSDKIEDSIVTSIGGNTDFVNDLSSDNGISIVSEIFQWFKGEIFSVIMIIAIGVFIFIGIRLATARGNPEEFKKAMIHFVYSIVGIFVIFIAWGAVKLVASLSL